MYELQNIDFENKRVLTTRQLAEMYEIDSRQIANNFNRNKDRYVLGKHYYILKGQDKQDFLNHHQFDYGLKKASNIYLWTEYGTLLHAKSLNTDKTWRVYENLIDNYFRIQPKLEIVNTSKKQMSDDEILLKAVMIANTRIEEQNKRILELETKNEYLDIILADNKGLNITQIAQDYGYSARKFNEILKDLGIQYKNNGQWILKAKYKDKRYVVSETFTIDSEPPIVKINTRWTQKGREFLYYKLKENGILPIIEKAPQI